MNDIMFIMNTSISRIHSSHSLCATISNGPWGSSINQDVLRLNDINNNRHDL